MRSANKTHSNSQWTASDKLRLYNAMTTLQEKDCTLYMSKQKLEQKEKLSRVKVLRMKIKNDRERLNSTKRADMQRLKRTLQRHNMNILNEENTFETVRKKIEYKLFTETNELHRLAAEEENLSKIYEKKLLDLSKIQDRIVHVDHNQLYDEIQANKLRLDIKNCETRMSSVKTINNLCHKIIGTLLQDFRSFDPALNALKNDIKEQNALLDAIMKLEIPANEGHQELFSECKELKENVEKNMKVRLATLNELTSHIVTSNEAVKRLIISDDDVNVKIKSKSIRKANLSDEAAVLRSDDAISRKAESEEVMESKEDQRKKKAENAMIQLYSELDSQIDTEHQIESDLSFAEKILIKIQSSFKHFKQILRQIGEDFEDQVNLESTFSETEILVRIVLHRCKVVMAIFNEKILKNDVPSSKMILNTSDLDDYGENDISNNNKDPDIMDDPSVPTRDRIKAISAKLVELNLKEE